MNRTKNHCNEVSLGEPMKCQLPPPEPEIQKISRLKAFLIRFLIAFVLAFPVAMPVVDRILHAFGICIGH